MVEKTGLWHVMSYWRCEFERFGQSLSPLLTIVCFRLFLETCFEVCDVQIINNIEKIRNEALENKEIFIFVLMFRILKIIYSFCTERMAKEILNAFIQPTGTVIFGPFQPIFFIL